MEVGASTALRALSGKRNQVSNGNLVSIPLSIGSRVSVLSEGAPEPDVDGRVNDEPFRNCHEGDDRMCGLQQD